MMRRMIRRIGTSLFVVWFVLTLTFLIHHALPSDPARAMAGLQARPADVAELRIQLGLDQPLWKQYSRYMGRLVRGDLGQSYQRHTAVATILKERAFNTLMLALAATTLQVFFGTLAGMSVAFRRFRWIDRSVVFITLVGISIPTFLSGLILQYWLAYRWRLVAFDGFGATLTEQLHSLILPALTLGSVGAAFYARYVRDEVRGILHEDYMRTARAKGLPAWRIMFVHGLRNALIPLITLLGMDLGTMMGGAVVTEKLFRWPGIGALTVDAILARDGPVVMGIVVVTSVSIVIANLFVDGLYVIIDPRIRHPAETA